MESDLMISENKKFSVEQEKQMPQMPSDKEITCVKNHLGVYDYFALEEKTADPALPCEICRYVLYCNLNSRKHTSWLHKMNDDKADIYAIGRYVANKKTTGYAMPSNRQTARIVVKGEDDINKLLHVMLRDKWILVDVIPADDGSGRTVYKFYKDIV